MALLRGKSTSDQTHLVLASGKLELQKTSHFRAGSSNWGYFNAKIFSVSPTCQCNPSNSSILKDGIDFEKKIEVPKCGTLSKSKIF